MVFSSQYVNVFIARVEATGQGRVFWQQCRLSEEKLNAQKGELFSKEVRSDREGGDSCDYGPWWENVVALNIEKKRGHPLKYTSCEVDG